MADNIELKPEMSDRIGITAGGQIEITLSDSATTVAVVDGSITIAKLNSAVLTRMLPTGGAKDQVLARNASNQPNWAKITTSNIDNLGAHKVLKGGSDGSPTTGLVSEDNLDQNLADMFLTDDEVGDKAFKNPPSDLSDSQKTAVRDAIGAVTGDGSGDDNVQADWDETDTADDAYIKNKPDISGIGTDQTARDAAAAAQNTADAALPKTGGTLTGKITLDGAPTSDLHAATKKYVDDNAGGEPNDLSGIEAEIDQLQHLTRDLHAVVEPGTWETSDDGVLIASTPDINGYDSTAFGSATAMVTNVAASNNNTPVSISIRVPAGADVSQYRLINDSGAIYPGNHWQNRNLGVAPADSSHDYYKYVFLLGQRETSYDWTLEKRSADIDESYYDGEFRGTFEDGIVPLDALAESVQAAIAAGGGGSSSSDIPDTEYLFYFRPTLSTTDVSAIQDVSSNPWTQVILNAESVEGRVYKDRDFNSRWFGGLEFEAGINGVADIKLKTTHTFNSKTIVSYTSVIWPVSRSIANFFPLTLLDGVTLVPTGSFTDDDGTTITITDDDLEGPTTISFEFQMDYENTRGNGSRTFSDLKWKRANAQFFQAGGGSAGGGSSDSTGGPLRWPGLTDSFIDWPM